MIVSSVTLGVSVSFLGSKGQNFIIKSCKTESLPVILRTAGRVGQGTKQRLIIVSLFLCLTAGVCDIKEGRTVDLHGMPKGYFLKRGTSCGFIGFFSESF